MLFVALAWLVNGNHVMYAQNDTAHGPRKEVDLPYVAEGGHKQQLDLYLPDGTGFPTIVLIHGGSLTEGDRKESPFPMIGETFQQAGVGCAVMSYRLAPAKWPAQPRDVAAAFAWLKQNIATYGGDRNKIFLVGHSSGAMLSALVSTDEKYLKEVGFSTQDIAGCIPMGTLLNTTWNLDDGPPEEHWSEAFTKRVFQENSGFRIYGNIQVYRDANPSSHIGPHMPPFLILVAEREREHPPILSQAETFAATAQKSGVRVEVDTLKDRTHNSTIKNMTTSDDPTVVRILRFVRAAGK